MHYIIFLIILQHLFDPISLLRGSVFPQTLKIIIEECYIWPPVSTFNKEAVDDFFLCLYFLFFCICVAPICQHQPSDRIQSNLEPKIRIPHVTLLATSQISPVVCLNHMSTCSPFAAAFSVLFHQDACDTL